MHLLLRPPKGRTAAGLREGLSDRVHQVRPARASASRCRRSACRNCRAAAWTTHSSTIRRTPASAALHAFFIVRGDPRQYNLPPEPEVPTIYLKAGWTAPPSPPGCLLFGSVFAFLGSAETMSDPPQRPTPRHRISRARQRLLEIRREAEQKGRVEAIGIRPPGAPFPMASPAHRLLRRSSAEAAARGPGRSPSTFSPAERQVRRRSSAWWRAGLATIADWLATAATRGRRHRSLHRTADLRSRAAFALSCHDARLQAAEPHVRRRVDAGGLRHLLRRRGFRGDAGTALSLAAGPDRRRSVGRNLRAGGLPVLQLHRSTDRRQRHPRLERKCQHACPFTSACRD